MKLLITGFMPFGGEKENPAWEAVKRLPDKVDGVSIIKQEIPVVFGEDFQVLEKAIRENTCPGQGGDLPCDQSCERLCAVICVGQAGGRSGITPEKIAINYQDARIPDNAGNSPRHQLILYPQKPSALSYTPLNEGASAGAFCPADGYFSSLPVEKMVEAMSEANIPASASLSAGAYVCNDLFYRLMVYLAKGSLAGDAHIGGGAIGGFIHVPFSSEQLEGREFPEGKLPPSLPLDTIASGLEICIRETIKAVKADR